MHTHTHAHTHTHQHTHKHTHTHTHTHIYTHIRFPPNTLFCVCVCVCVCMCVYVPFKFKKFEKFKKFNKNSKEPFSIGQLRLPSTAFCLLYKFFLMKLTHKQMKGLIEHADSPYIRGIGFLYLRFVVPPKHWYEFALSDKTKFCPGGDKDDKMCVYVCVCVYV